MPLDNDCLEQKLAKLVAYNETDLKKDLLQSLKEFYIRYTAGQLEYRKKKIKEKNRELVEEDINKAIADAKAQLPIWFTEKRDESELRNLFKDTLLKLKKQLKNLDCQHRLGKDLVQLEQDFEAQLISYRKKNSHENQHKVEILEVSRSKSTSPGSLETRDKLMNYNEFRTAFAKRHGSTSREGQSLAWAEYKKTGGSSFKKL